MPTDPGRNDAEGELEAGDAVELAESIDELEVLMLDVLGLDVLRPNVLGLDVLGTDAATLDEPMLVEVLVVESVAECEEDVAKDEVLLVIGGTIGELTAEDEIEEDDEALEVEGVLGLEAVEDVLSIVNIEPLVNGPEYVMVVGSVEVVPPRPLLMELDTVLAGWLDNREEVEVGRFELADRGS